MTSQADQLQTLIQQIDGLLSQSAPRLPWLPSAAAAHQRRVLEAVRTYLDQQLNQQLSQPPVDPAPPTLAMPAAGANSASSGLDDPEASAQQVLQSVLQEMGYLRANLLQPLRADLETLQQRRAALLQEIRQLEATAQQYGMPQSQPHYVVQFLQAALAQMQENLSGQVVQLFTSLSGSSEAPLIAGDASAGSLANGGLPDLGTALSPMQRLAYLQQVQSQSDRLLTQLDGTLQLLFGSLQSNLHSYADSLESGLVRMHGLGQQSEAVFGAVLTRLVQQLGRDASAYLQASAQGTAPTQPDWMPEFDRASSVDERRPMSSAGGGSPALDLAAGTSTEIDQLLSELDAIDQLSSLPSSSLPSSSLPLSAANPPSAAPDALQLDQLGQALQALDLSQITADLDEQDFSLFSEPLGLAEPSDEPRTQFQLDGDEAGEPTWMQPSAPAFPDDRPAIPAAPPDAATQTLLEDLETAIDLLNQISAEADEVKTVLQTDEPFADLDQDFGILENGSSPDLSRSPIESVPSPDALYQDEFYQSFFGETAATAPIESADASSVDLQNGGLEAGFAESEHPASENPASPPELDRPEAKGSPLSPEAENSEATHSDEQIYSIADAPSQTEDDWFELTQPPEPAPATNGSAIPQVQPDLPQSLETLLLQPPPSPQPVLTIDLTPIADRPDAEPAGPETIASLLERLPLMSEAIAAVPMPSPEPSQDGLGDILSEEEFQVAAADEDLLNPRSTSQEAPELQLPATTMQQLEADLEKLISGHLPEAADWLSLDKVEPDSAKAESSENAFSLEDLEGDRLFEGAPLNPPPDAPAADSST